MTTPEQKLVRSFLSKGVETGIWHDETKHYCGWCKRYLPSWGEYLLHLAFGHEGSWNVWAA